MANTAAFILLAWVIFLAIAETRLGANAKNGVRDCRLFTNFSLAVMVLSAGAVFPIAKLAASAAAQSWQIGIVRAAHLPWLALFGLAILAETFAAYWAHRFTHAVPLLWRLHRVHHADEQVDLSTSFRSHFLELIITLPVSVVVVVILGTPQSVVAAIQTLLVGVTLWQHADIVLPARLDRALAFVVVTPQLHRLHHHPGRATHDGNYGELLTLWDRLFGTLSRSQARGRVGLDDQVAHPDRLLQQIWSPIYAA